jgi:LmbE family N-acetylglucosaminyl deacetylase
MRGEKLPGNSGNRKKLLNKWARVRKLTFFNKEDLSPKILCLGAHCDDIEIGCGGTILQFLETHNNSSIHWIVFSANQERSREASKSAHIFLKHAQEKNIVIQNFRNSFFPFIGTEIKEYFEQFKKQFVPDIIFTHYRNDLHQDHRLIAELTWNTFRDHLIVEYEIPKYDGDLGSPNVFIHLNESVCRKKIRYILNSFKTQHENHWFTEDTFLSLLRLRGIESNSPTKYAEAFYCRKMIFD